jgi:hypothetical protein
VAGRRSVWSDERVAALATEFVPAADEVWRLQRGAEADCRFFQRMVNGGELITDKRSRQGIWVCSPNGTLLASINSLDPDRVLATLQRGLRMWESLPADERRLAADAELDPEHRWENFYPDSGLALERIARDLDQGGTPQCERSGRWNRDFAWFTQEEARAWLPKDPRPGDERAVPSDSIRRLTRFHFVDNVRGQTLPFAADEILKSELTATVIARGEATVELRLSGATDAVAPGPWLLGDNLWRPHGEFPRGIATRLLGRATYDLEREVFTRFDLVALGRRFGRSQFNGRKDEPPGLIGFHLTLARPADRIAPTFVAVYDAEWVESTPR